MQSIELGLIIREVINPTREKVGALVWFYGATSLGGTVGHRVLFDTDDCRRTIALVWDEIADSLGMGRVGF